MVTDKIALNQNDQNNNNNNNTTTNLSHLPTISNMNHSGTIADYKRKKLMLNY